MSNNILIYCEALRVLNLIVDLTVNDFELNVKQDENLENVRSESVVSRQESYLDLEPDKSTENQQLEFKTLVQFEATKLQDALLNLEPHIHFEANKSEDEPRETISFENDCHSQCEFEKIKIKNKDEPVVQFQTAKSQKKLPFSVDDFRKNFTKNSLKFCLKSPSICIQSLTNLNGIRRFNMRKTALKLTLQSNFKKLHVGNRSLISVEMSLLLRPTMHVCQLVRIDLFQLFKCFKLVKTLIENRRMRLVLKQVNIVGVKRIECSSRSVISEISSFHRDLLNTDLINKKSEENTETKLGFVRKDLTKEKQKKITSYFLPEKKQKIRFTEPESLSLKYHTFEIMPPTQCEEVDIVENLQDEEICSFQKNTESPKKDEDSIFLSPLEEIEEEEPEIQPVFVESIFLSPPPKQTPDQSNIFIDFKPVKHEPTPWISISKFVNIDYSQPMPGDLERMRLEQGTQMCPTQPMIGAAKMTAKRRIFMKHGLSKKQRIRQHLHQFIDK